MFSAKEIMSVCLAGILAIFGGVYTASCSNYTPHSQVESIHPLENARRSVIFVRFTAYGNAGSAFIVGRQRVDDDTYLYRAITAHHVTSRLSRAMDEYREKLQEQMLQELTLKLEDESPIEPIEPVKEVNNSVAISMQPTFHGVPVHVTTKVQTVDWTVPSLDWSSFTFKLDNKHFIPHVELATDEEFRTIKPYEIIYGCGGDDGYVQLLKQGIIAATHNEHSDRNGQLMYGRYPWENNTHAFFRAHMDIWYGASGSPVFNKDGRVIGIVNAFATMNGNGVAAHSCISLKSSKILECLGIGKDKFFKVEK